MTDPLILQAWNYGLGDHWATLNYAINRSLVHGVPVQISRWQNGSDIGDRLNEILSLLSLPPGAQVDIVGEEPTWQPPGHAIWSAPSCPTKYDVWSPAALGALRPTIVYHFDGVSAAAEKNPPREDYGELMGFLRALDGLYGIRPVQLTGAMPLHQCTRLASDALCFLGVDSGMSHIAHSVGVPIFLLEYQLPVITAHRNKRYTLCEGTHAAISLVADFVRALRFPR